MEARCRRERRMRGRILCHRQAKRIPGAKSFAYDLDPLAQVACKTARDINHIDLVVLGLCTDAELRERTEKAERPFMLVDCEGGERELLLSNEYSYPNARIIVECHDFVDRSITSSLVESFLRHTRSRQ